MLNVNGLVGTNLNYAVFLAKKYGYEVWIYNQEDGSAKKENNENEPTKGKLTIRHLKGVVQKVKLG